jgi:hypothetical protein
MKLMNDAMYSLITTWHINSPKPIINATQPKESKLKRDLVIRKLKDRRLERYMESGSEESAAPEKISILELLVNKSFKLNQHGQYFVVKSDSTSKGQSRKLIKISKEPIVFDGEPCEIIFVSDQTSDLHLFDEVK